MADSSAGYENTQAGVTNAVPKVNPLKTQGATGLWRTSGFVIDDVMPQLRGLAGIRLYREMSDNESIIGGFLGAIEQIILKVDWWIESYRDDEEGAEPTDADEEQRAFLESCLTDLDDSWHTNLQGVLGFLPFGWSWHEILYKRRIGPNKVDEGGHTSTIDDGLIGWAGFPLRAQDSLYQWKFGPDGAVVAMVQRDPATGSMYVIPFDKSLLFRTTVARGNPEGRSVLRNCVIDYLFLRRFREFEAIGIERDIAGMLKAYAPEEWFFDSATDDQKSALAALTETVQNVKRNQSDGIVIPSVFDEEHNRILDIELFISPGQRQFDVRKTINDYRSNIAMAVLADFLTMGHENVGAFNLGISKIDLFMTSIEARVRSVAEIMNAYAIPRLLKLNGMNVSRMATLKYGQISQIDLAALGAYLLQLFQAGLLTPDGTLEEYLRKIADLPARDPEDDAAAYSRGPMSDLEAAADAIAAPPAGDGTGAEPPDDPAAATGPDPGDKGPVGATDPMGDQLAPGAGGGDVEDNVSASK